MTKALPAIGAGPSSYQGVSSPSLGDGCRTQWVAAVEVSIDVTCGQAQCQKRCGDRGLDTGSLGEHVAPFLLGVAWASRCLHPATARMACRRTPVATFVQDCRQLAIVRLAREHRWDPSPATRLLAARPVGLTACAGAGTVPISLLRDHVLRGDISPGATAPLPTSKMRVAARCPELSTMSETPGPVAGPFRGSLPAPPWRSRRTHRAVTVA